MKLDINIWGRITYNPSWIIKVGNQSFLWICLNEEYVLSKHSLYFYTFNFPFNYMTYNQLVTGNTAEPFIIHRYKEMPKNKSIPKEKWQGNH